MILWTITFLSLAYALYQLTPLWIKFKQFLGQGAHILELRKSIEHLKLICQILESGLVPEQNDWDHCKHFPKPWGIVIHQSLSELRSKGAPVLPSLHRMQRTLSEQVEQIQEAKVKGAQAFGQAMVGFIMIPMAALALYFLLPGIKEVQKSFFILVLFALFLNSLSVVWMISMAERARFGNLESGKRSWMVSVDATFDRLIALISTGLPPDLSWKRSLEELSLSDPKLAESWGLQIWDTEVRSPLLVLNDVERLMNSIGIEVKKSIQTSLIEGRACLDRIESTQRAFQIDLRMLVSKELNLLPNRCLKPLFVFVLPSFLILLGGSFYLTLGDLLS